MKRIYTLLLVLATIYTARAQDTLTRIDGKKVGVIVKEVRPFDVVYSKVGWTSGRPLSYPRA